MSARQKIEKEPNYAYVAGRLLISNIHKEVFGESHDKDIFEAQYKNAFVRNIKKLIKFGTLREELLDFDLKALSEAIDPDRDLKFKYLEHRLSTIDTSPHRRQKTRNSTGVLDASCHGACNKRERQEWQSYRVLQCTVPVSAMLLHTHSLQ